jgi:hypothetical protein
MKSAKEILLQMAFNPKAPESTKQALLKSMQNALLENEKAEVIPVESQKVKKGEQLSFDFSGGNQQKNRA